MKRETWLDLLRGIAMIAVVMGHMLFEGDLYVYFFSFQVSLFFLISGIAYGITPKFENMTMAEFTKNKFKQLVIPYFWLNIFFFPIWFVNNIILQGKSFSAIIKVIGGIFYSNQSVLPMSSYSTWFLTCLFLVSIIFKFIQTRTQNNSKKINLIIFIFAIIGTLLPLIGIKSSLPWHLQTVFIAIIFYYLGYIFIKNRQKISTFLNKIIKSKFFKYVTIIIFLIIGFLIARKNGKISLRNSNYKNMLYFYSSAIITSFSYVFLARLINKSRILEFIGTNTLVILASHRIIMRFFLYISAPTKYFVETYPIITGILILLINVPLIILINKYFPFIVGKRKKANGNLL